MSGDAAPDLARRRWLLLVLARLLPTAGAVFGVVLLGRATTTGAKVLGIAIVVSALLVVAVVPRHLAHRWRSR